ncbi:MAG TPA: hypothetical protein VG097_01705 [Gemmata sp.]|jgi:hypothetical protein|nr:hypothetical protein [Gemmata sp.]
MFERIGPNDLPRFLRQYRLAGGRIHRVRLQYPGLKKVAIEFYLTVRETIKNLGTEPGMVRLILRLEGVEEYRLQMRPGQPKVKIADARIGYLNDLFFVNFDAWGLEPGEQPKLHDFRASEAYAGGRELFVREVRPDEKGEKG